LVTLAIGISATFGEVTATELAQAAPAESTPRILTQPVKPIGGPKRVVAVGKFDAIGAFKEKYGDWDIGGGLAAMLTTALKESEQFIVLERANVGQILSEQELKSQRLVREGSGPTLGQITGVNLMIYGAVTEFGEDSGGGFSLGASGGRGGGSGSGIGFGGLGGVLTGALSQQSTSGKVAMDIRIVDTTTTEVLENYKIEEKIETSGWDASVGYKGLSFGGNQFMKTPLGEACRRSINTAVQRIAARSNSVEWSAQVVEFDGQLLYVNAGGNAGLKVGDKFMIRRILKVLTDPATGQVLDKVTSDLGVVQLTGVKEKIASGSFLALSGEKPKRGDLVVETKTAN
jgi:curli biogenesis system outer membrane secretion channel CsgG